MKWLIGEIGVSLLIASLIGLLVGWMISQFFRSRALGQNRNHYEGALHERDREIRRLRSDLQHETSRERNARRRPEAPRTATRTAPGPAKVQTGVAAGPSSAPPVKRPPPTKPSTKVESSKVTTRRPAIGQPGKYAAVAKDMRGDSASLRVKTDERKPSKVDQKAVEDEAYAKIKAFAELGERDRQLQYAYTPAAKPEKVIDPSATKALDQYQKLLEQKNTQVDDLQRKVRELLATQSRTPEPVGLSSVRERQLVTNVEQESYEKVRAFAGWGEAERKLSLVENVKPQADPEVGPLRRRAEQQDSVIADLRKRLELQQKQAEDARRESELRLSQVKNVKPVEDPNIQPLRRRAEQQDSTITDLRKRLEKQQQQLEDNRRDYELKISSRDNDLATLRADVSNKPDQASLVEIESYKRKVAELERTAQNRIKEFNGTLEARNKEYDQLGTRLEETISTNTVSVSVR